MFIVQTFMIYLRATLKVGILLRTLFKTLFFFYKLSVYVRKLCATLFIKHSISSSANFLFDMLIGLWVTAIWNVQFFSSSRGRYWCPGGGRAIKPIQMYYLHHGEQTVVTFMPEHSYLFLPLSIFTTCLC